MNAVYEILTTVKHGAFLKLKSLGLINEVQEQTSYLDFLSPSMPQRFWHIRNDKHEVVYCDVCKKNPAKFHQAHGYVACSRECASIKNGKSSSESAMRKYGVSSTLKLPQVRKKAQATMQDRYGVDNFSKSKDFHSKVLSTSLERYGAELYHFTDEFRNGLTDRYKNQLITRLGADFEVLSFINKRHSVELRHAACGTTFTIKGATLYYRLGVEKVCPMCHPCEITSFKEQEMTKYVQSIYSGSIRERDRIMVKPQELDIYLPEIKLAIEFNGTFYHADSRFYEEDDMIFRRTVKEVRDNDSRKAEACAKAGISLLTVWEYDWDNHTDAVKRYIQSEIDKKIK